MDVVGFTSMSKEVPAQMVMRFLNELFGKFDAMCDYYDVYKVRVVWLPLFTELATSMLPRRKFLQLAPPSICPNHSAAVESFPPRQVYSCRIT